MKIGTADLIKITKAETVDLIVNTFKTPDLAQTGLS
jgi:hypothetical protein